MSSFGAFFQALAAALGLAKKRQELNNTPEMQRRAEGKASDAVISTTREAVKDGDLEKVRRLTSE